MSQLKKHLFICTKCTYKKADGSDSDPEEGASLRRSLKNRIRSSDHSARVQVTSSGCLGQCDFGISAVLYPEGQWLTGLRFENEDEIFQSLTKD